MRFGLAVAFGALVALLVAREVSGESSPALVYLHPAVKGSDTPAEVTSGQIHRILSHHLNVPHSDDEDISRERVGSHAWDWLTTPPITYKGKQVLTSSDQSSDKTAQRTFILLSDLSLADMNEVIPEKLRNTHLVLEAPRQSSFEALAESYGQRIHGAGVAGIAQSFAGFFVAAAEGMEHALEGAGEWLVGQGFPSSKSLLDQTHLAVDETSKSFYSGLRNLISYMDVLDQTTSSDVTIAPYQTLRLSGFGEIRAAYGEASPELRRAKEALRDVLTAAVEKFDSLGSSRSHALALIVAPPNDETLAFQEGELQKRNRLLFPFRANIVLTPFLTTRSVSDPDDGMTARQDTGSALKSKPSKRPDLPKDSDLASQCFKSEGDLNKASQNCTGHGIAVQTSRGGRKCYRCKCQTSKAKGGKLIDWTGEACQRQSIAKPFALLAVTTLVLVIVSYASVYFLYGEGSKELPSVLAGISIPTKSR